MLTDRWRRRGRRGGPRRRRAGHAGRLHRAARARRRPLGHRPQRHRQGPRGGPGGALALATFDLDRLVVDAGGDLLHRGAGALRVGVEDPHRPYDNVAPLAVVEVADRAVATSGRARRWFAVGADRHSRVLDRTGRPVAHAASATVVAPDATTADVLATVASVLAPGEAVAFVDGLAADGIDAARLVVTADGDRHASAGWSALVRQRGEASSSVLGLNGR
ncbi:MAG: FAD:protein FMN transferase [Acidimicrobiales bacterium]